MTFPSRRYLVFLLDLVVIACAYILAYLFNSDFQLFSRPELLTHILPTVIVSKGAVFLFSRLYRSIWKYASLPDMLEIIKTVSLASVFSLFAILFIREYEYFSRVIFILDWGILLFLMVASRLLWRVYREMYVLPRLKSGPKTLIVGAGEAGNQLLQEISR